MNSTINLFKFRGNREEGELGGVGEELGRSGSWGGTEKQQTEVDLGGGTNDVTMSIVAALYLISDPVVPVKSTSSS